jgi:hypothetical protein
MSHSPIFQVLRIGCLLLAVLAIGILASPATSARQKPDKPGSKSSKKDKAEEAPRPLEPWEKFVPDFADSDLDGSEARAWEYRPYKVACWFCLDGSPRVNAMYPQAAAEVIRRSELLDASGWDLTIGQAPARYRHLFLQYLATPERCVGFADQEVLNEYDKLMIVCLRDDASQIQASVREFDVQTQQWGPINNRTIAFSHSAGQKLMDAIANSFMPLAQIERVTEVEVDVNGKKQMRDEVLMQLRAVQSCVRTNLKRVMVQTTAADENAGSAQDNSPQGENVDGESSEDSGSAEQSSGSTDGPEQISELIFERTVVPAVSSPAFIRSTDLFLPVIRRTDRYKNLIGLEPLEFTFLTVKKQEGAEVRAAIQSRGRAPLSQRKSKKAKKLALVIRPPQESTTLRLKSNEKQPIPMEGFTILERPRDATDAKMDKVLGQTDWKGEFEVEPSESGLRVLIVKRGARRLNKLPVVPGLYEKVESPVRNDETRLYAQGVFQGFENELLGLIIQRQVVRTKLNSALKKKVAVTAKEHFDELRDLEELNEIRERLNSAVVDLKSRTTDKKEAQYISMRHESLQKLLTKKISEERNIHYDKEKKEFGKSYLEQIQALEAADQSSDKKTEAAD